MIRQCYVSKSIADFPFEETYGLTTYLDSLKPCVFFGMYSEEDLNAYRNHNGKKIIFWTGHDALTFKDWARWSDVTGSINVTAHLKVHKLILQYGKCDLVHPAAFLNTPAAQKIGRKIYAYCPEPVNYHGKNIIDDLRCAGYEIVIGDGKTHQSQWHAIRKYYYDDLLIGLCLSEFAGGGGSIIEMGLLGVNVVTNVFDLPNCFPFRDAQDISYIIEQEKYKIGITDHKLAQDVWTYLDHDHKWMNI